VKGEERHERSREGEEWDFHGEEGRDVEGLGVWV